MPMYLVYKQQCLYLHMCSVSETLPKTKNPNVTFARWLCAKVKYVSHLERPDTD